MWVWLIRCALDLLYRLSTRHINYWSCANTAHFVYIFVIISKTLFWVCVIKEVYSERFMFLLHAHILCYESWLLTHAEFHSAPFFPLFKFFAHTRLFFIIRLECTQFSCVCVWNHSLFQLDFYANGCAVNDSNQDNIRSLKRVDFLMRGIKGLLFDCMAQHENIIFFITNIIGNSFLCLCGEI